jgi:simple sugar transport system ATP-binding protein
MRRGRMVGTVPGSTDERELARMMVGRPTFGVGQQETFWGGGEALLKVRGVSASGTRGLTALHDISLEVHAGEIVGVAGVSGNGQTELAEVLSGMRPVTAGSVLVDDHELAGADPAAVMAAGVGRIPEDRHASLVLELPVAMNLILEHIDDFTRGGRLDRRLVEQHARRLIEEYSIKAHPGDRVATLSGGNIQKVLLARVLSRSPRVVIVSQPTRGLDVGASEYVREALLSRRRDGAAVLLFSEDLEELLSLSDRIVVLYEGRIVGHMAAAGADPERLGMLMAGRGQEAA